MGDKEDNATICINPDTTTHRRNSPRHRRMFKFSISCKCNSVKEIPEWYDENLEKQTVKVGGYPKMFFTRMGSFTRCNV